MQFNQLNGIKWEWYPHFSSLLRLLQYPSIHTPPPTPVFLRMAALGLLALQFQGGGSQLPYCPMVMLITNSTILTSHFFLFLFFLFCNKSSLIRPVEYPPFEQQNLCKGMSSGVLTLWSVCIRYLIKILQLLY